MAEGITEGVSKLSINYDCIIKIPIEKLRHIKNEKCEFRHRDRDYNESQFYYPADEDLPNGIFYYPDSEKVIKLYTLWEEGDREVKFTVKTLQLSSDEREIYFEKEPESKPDKQTINTNVYTILKDKKEEVRKDFLIIEWKKKPEMNSTVDRNRTMKIGAFNTQKKVDDTLMGVIERFDLILLQESVKEIEKYLTIFNNLNQKRKTNGNCAYYAIASKLSYNDERYIFVYNTKYLIFREGDQYLDTTLLTNSRGDTYTLNTFSRPPYLVLFGIKYCEIEDFLFIPLHAHPSKTIKGSISEEYQLYQSTYNEIYKLLQLPTMKKEKSENFIIGGDLNWDESFIPNREKRTTLDEKMKDDIKLVTPFKNTMKIPRENNPKVYDRLLIKGKMNQFVIPNSGIVYYDVKMSDHFPIGFDIKLR
ncbi:DgyrCDS14395 [Dimorphilus gyrociliatus]|uniref:DgyrCDS14395 n=1 Tax=Dimorphilus gyrociliatus TaxID=2664684 RepID=A0A7I8WDE8_9ANNE|nr:DgyrCDS14395 [Dimorphilus gyrociliatus]